MELEEARFLSAAISAKRAKSVSWSISLADFRDSNKRISSRRFLSSITPYAKSKSQAKLLNLLEEKTNFQNTNP